MTEGKQNRKGAIKMAEWISSMSMEEKIKIIKKSKELKAMGKEEEAMELIKKIPVKPELADDVKRLNGIKWLIDGGYNLADAVSKFGDKWLHA